MLLTKNVAVKITQKNIDYYVQHGYFIQGKEIVVDINDLCPNSTIEVEIKCDYCGKVFYRQWCNFYKSLHEDFKKNACKDCSGKRVAEYKKIKYGTMQPTVISQKMNNDKLFKKIPYGEIFDIYKSYGCQLLFSKDEYENSSNLKKTKASYICSCGNVQHNRTIDYFINKHQLCEECSKEKRKRDQAFELHNDYESVKNKLMSDNKELITKKEYFTKNDDIEYRCLLCNRINKVKYYTFNDKVNLHVCSGCKQLTKRKEKWDNLQKIASDNELVILTTFEQFVNDQSRLDIQCNCGNYYNTLVSEFLYKQKRQCNICGIKTRSGEFSPRWKGGITPEIQQIRHSSKYVNWRAKVFERDNYTCVCCNDNTGHNLAAHHIFNFSDYDELRFDVKNGVTLCNKCHNPNCKMSFHNIYGTKNNNIEQLQEYVDNRRKYLNLPSVNILDILN